MNTTIEYKDGQKFTQYQVAPSIDLQCGTITLVDSGSNCIGDDIPVSLVKRVTFETE